MSDETVLEKLGGRALRWAWNHPDEVLKRILKVNNWFKKKNSIEPIENRSEANSIRERGILIIGPAGVGKTTVARMLAGEFDDILTDAPGNYRESFVIEEFNLNDDPNVGIIVAPGQEHRRDTWKDLFSQVAAGEYRGIILLNAFGYHTFGIAYKNHKIYPQLSKPKTKAKFLSAFLEDRRYEELRVMENLSHHLQLCSDKLWILTVVTKQDLWWNDREAVSKYYLHSTYETQILNMLGQHDPRNRRHETAFVSLVINNFADGEGEILRPNTAGFDHKEQVSSLRRLFEIVFDLMEWEQN